MFQQIQSGWVMQLEFQAIKTGSNRKTIDVIKIIGYVKFKLNVYFLFSPVSLKIITSLT